MNNIVLVFNNRAYENNFEIEVDVEEIELPPQDGFKVFVPGTVTYTITLPDFLIVSTTQKPYRFEYNNKLFYVFNAI